MPKLATLAGAKSVMDARRERLPGREVDDMFICEQCEKDFPTTQALGSHKRYAHNLLPVLSLNSQTLRVPDSQGLKLSDSQTLRLSDSQSPVIKQVEKLAHRYNATGLRHNQINWGKLIPALAIGGFVAWLIYKSLENWEFTSTGKKQISPYKLIGGLIGGLG